jgi:hypothetical protein
MAGRMRYGDAQARQIFRDLIDMLADLANTQHEVRGALSSTRHLPIVLASGLIDQPSRCRGGVVCLFVCSNSGRNQPVLGKFRSVESQPTRPQCF